MDETLLSLRMALRDLRRDMSCKVAIFERDGLLVIEIAGMKITQTEHGKRIERGDAPKPEPQPVAQVVEGVKS